jgi:type-F conjugative transfer system pilin assembly protein TrbC
MFSGESATAVCFEGRGRGLGVRGRSEEAKNMKRIVLFLLSTFLFPNPSHAEDRLYYFWSFSVPKASVQEVLSQGAKIGLVAVLRGLPEQPMKESLMQLQEIVGDRKINLQIDPILFSLYKISMAPAYVFAEGVRTDCEHCQLPTRFWAVLGDVPLETALERIARSTPSAEAFLKKLRERFYDKGP